MPTDTLSRAARVGFVGEERGEFLAAPEIRDHGRLPEAMVGLRPGFRRPTGKALDARRVFQGAAEFTPSGALQAVVSTMPVAETAAGLALLDREHGQKAEAGRMSLPRRDRAVLHQALLFRSAFFAGCSLRVFGRYSPFVGVDDGRQLEPGLAERWEGRRLPGIVPGLCRCTCGMVR